MKKILYFLVSTIAMYAQKTVFLPNRLVNNNGTVKAGDTITLIFKVSLKALDSSKTYVNLRFFSYECNTMPTSYTVLQSESFNKLSKSGDSLVAKFKIPDLGNTELCLGFRPTLLVVCKAGCTSGTYYEQYIQNKAELKMSYNNAPNAVIDDIIAENGELLYCLDLTGKVVEPRGFCIAVFENGLKKKVIFEQ